MPDHQRVVARHRLRDPELLRTRNQVVHQDAQAGVRARGELGHDRGEVVDALQVLDDHALDPQVVPPHLLDQLRVVPTLDVDTPRPGHPRAGTGNRHRTGRGTGRTYRGRR